MVLMLADFWLYPLLGAAFVAGYARTTDDDGRGGKARFAAAADVLFLAALPLLALLFWRHGVVAGVVTLLSAWAVAMVGDQVHRRLHAPRPVAQSSARQLTVDSPALRWSRSFPAAPRHLTGCVVRHARRRSPMPAGRSGRRRLASRH
jgi:hypothetical protein